MTKWALPDAIRTYKALAHPVRLRILVMLQKHELCVCQLTAVLSLATSTVSAHLADLRRAGLVRERKAGRWVHYSWEEAPQKRRLVTQVVSKLEGDPSIEEDARLRAEVLAVPLETLCRAGMKLERLGIPTGRQAGLNCAPTAAPPAARRGGG